MLDGLVSSHPVKSFAALLADKTEPSRVETLLVTHALAYYTSKKALQHQPEVCGPSQRKETSTISFSFDLAIIAFALRSNGDARDCPITLFMQCPW